MVWLKNAEAQTQVVCQPPSQNGQVGVPVSFSASGGNGTYQWFAPDGTPNGGSGPAFFSTTFNTGGAWHYVTVQSNSQSSTCEVFVAAAAGSAACSPQVQSVPVGLPANLAASGGDGINYSWSAPNSNNQTGSGQLFNTSYSTAGTYNVTVTSAGNTSPSCTINVTAATAVGTPSILEIKNGSIHAGARFGDEPCLEQDTPTTSKPFSSEVKGTSGSKADYAVSAGGRVSNFASGGTPTPIGLTFGNQAPEGFYGLVCRPDLAKKYLADSSIPNNGANVTLNIGSLPSALNGISKYSGNLTIEGGMLKKGMRVTLVVNGNVYIKGNITFEDNYTSVAQIPSLGVIATGVINIDPSVTSIYGIYYAGTGDTSVTSRDGRINTCETGLSTIISTLDPTVCNNPLTVNGALIAKNIYFRRTATASAAEVINYLPQLILRPPLGLGGITDQL